MDENINTESSAGGQETAGQEETFSQAERSFTQAEMDARTKERDDALAELEQMKRERYLLQKGVSAEDVDYYAYKIGKQVTDQMDFRQAADAYLKEHRTAGRGVRIDTGAQLGGGGKAPTANETMNSILRGIKK